MVDEESVAPGGKRAEEQRREDSLALQYIAMFTASGDNSEATYAQLSNGMGVPASTLKKKVLRALQRLKLGGVAVAARKAAEACAPEAHAARAARQVAADEARLARAAREAARLAARKAARKAARLAALEAESARRQQWWRERLAMWQAAKAHAAEAHTRVRRLRN